MNDRPDVAKSYLQRTVHIIILSGPVRRGVQKTHAMAYSSTKTGVNGNFVLCKHIECNGLFGLL